MVKKYEIHIIPWLLKKTTSNSIAIGSEAKWDVVQDPHQVSVKCHNF